jgi:hypothetical protein
VAIRSPGDEVVTSRADVLRVLSRLLTGGPIERLPKKRAEADVILALAAAGLEPGRTYAERDINEYLSFWLEGFAGPVGLDHVTVRRALVDSGYLLRDPSGHAYKANVAKIDAVLAEDARSVRPSDVLASLNEAREARRRAHALKPDE